MNMQTSTKLIITRKTRNVKTKRKNRPRAVEGGEEMKKKRILTEEEERYCIELEERGLATDDLKERRRIHRELRKYGNPGFYFHQRYPHFDLTVAIIACSVSVANLFGLFEFLKVIFMKIWQLIWT